MSNRQTQAPLSCAIHHARSPAVAAVFAFLLWAASSHGVESNLSLSQLLHEKWQTEQGLPQNAVHCLAQDLDGFIWFGTENGLVRFDGVRFEVFSETSEPSVPHNFVSSLLVSKDGTLWAGTRTGGFWRYRGGNFDQPFPALAQAEVWAMAETADGKVWVGTKTGLYSLGSDGTARHFGAKEGLPTEHISALHASGEDLWIGTRQGEVLRLSGETMHVVVGSGTFAGGAAVKGLAHDPVSGEAWFAHDGAGLFVLRGNQLTRIDLLPNRESEYLQALHRDPEGTLWIGTQDQGLVRYSAGSISFFKDEHGLPDQDVLSVLRDREGSIWVGTHFGGLNRLLEGKALTYTKIEGLPTDAVTCVVEEDSETLWLGTLGGGLLKFAHCVFTPVPLGEPLFKPRNDVRALLRARDGEIWIGTHGGGLGRHQTNGTVQFFTTKDGLVDDWVSVLFQRKNGEIWIGTVKNGINIYDSSGTLRTMPVPEFMRTHLRAMVEDSRGNIWIGTQNGLAKYANDRFEQVKVPEVPDLSVRTLVCDPDDTLWIGARDHGLIRLREGKAVRFESMDGLVHNRIYQILVAGPDLWLAGNQGMERVSKANLENVAEGRAQQLHTQLLTKREGLRSIECGSDSSPSAAVASNGTLWIGTRGGLVKIDPTLTEREGRQPNVLIRSLAVDKERIWPRDFRGLLPGATRLQIDYTAPSLRNPANVFFKYKMGRVDSDWVDAGRSREAVYYNLKPGEYTFQVKACNDEGVWNETGATLAFTVAPRLYQTAWFQSGAILAVISGIVGAFRWRTKSVRDRNRELKSLVDERTLELQSEVTQRADAEQQLRLLNEELEIRVKARTVEVRNAYENLQMELHERQEAEQALARSEARLRRIVDSGMVGILFWHRDGSITEANNTFLRMVGYTREELEEGLVSWDKLTPPGLLALDAAALKEIEKTGVCTPFEKEYLRKDGSRVPILIGGASLGHDAERGVCFVLDITERKATEEEIRQLNLMLEARVTQRTAELARANEQLASEVHERKRVAVALAAFSRLGQKLHSARTEQEAAAIVAESAKALVPHEVCSIELYDPDGRLAAVLDAPAPGTGAAHPGPHCSISVSIRNGSRVVGVLGLKSTRLEGFNFADANTLQALGDYCGGALERIHAEEARRETERRFSIFMRNAPALAWMKDSQFRYVFTNEMFQRFTGRQADEIEGKTDYDLWPDHVAFHMRTNDTRIVESQANLETQEQLKRYDGETRTLLTLRFLFTTTTGEQFVAGMSVDISEQKRAEEALHRLPQSIIEAQEAERRRVARELHDGVNQAIASIKFRIQTAEQQILRADPKWQETCGKTKEMLDSVLQQVRRLSRNLRPGELDDFGLVPAARSACQEFETRTGITVKFSHSEFVKRLPPTLELSLYRIIQESLTNVEKHASASEAVINLETDESYVTLEISDNGCGFEMHGAPERRAGLGLLHMRERASLIGGVFSMVTSPGEGVHLTIHAPIRRGEEALSE